MLEHLLIFRGKFSIGSDGKESTCDEGDLGSIPGLVRSQEEGMATHSSILAWRIPMDREAWWAAYSPRGHKESDTTGQLNTAHGVGLRGQRVWRE